MGGCFSRKRTGVPPPPSPPSDPEVVEDVSNDGNDSGDHAEDPEGETDGNESGDRESKHEPNESGDRESEHEPDGSESGDRVDAPESKHEPDGSESGGRVDAPESKIVVFPYARVDAVLHGLTRGAEGFGRRAEGGVHGDVYRVTSLADDGRGSLRNACRKPEPLWIIFEVSGTISLLTYLRVSSKKTIDGRGQKVTLTGKGIQLRNVEHIVICNIEFEGGRGPDTDAIQIIRKSKNVWIDRCSLRDYDGGLIKIAHASTDITISRCHFTKNAKGALIGAGISHVSDRDIRVTIHHCFFDGTRQWNPFVRFGKVHLYNNYMRDWDTFGPCAGVESQIVSQCNIYEAGQRKNVFGYYYEKAADKAEATTGLIRSEGELFLNGALPHLLPGSAERVFDPRKNYSRFTKQSVSAELKELLETRTGWQAVPRPPENEEGSDE